MSDSKTPRKRAGVAALAALLLATTAGGSYIAGKSRAEGETRSAIARMDERIRGQQEMIDTLRSNNEVLQGMASVAGEHGSPLTHVLRELREHPPGDEEMKRILEGLSAQEHERADNPVLDECCRRTYETVRDQLRMYGMTHDKDLGLRIQVGFLWLHKGCGRKLSEVSRLSDSLGIR